ncbi:hypothetical protein LTR24_005634 [Lithohypha guttulata]|uniref:Uncharacterized protein n=1 Tax=Lithohypha guttulata TaxID=1690604 RepID=A0ABR0K8I2_9EURO|nr:hypothetical protein LTR24_005634 [Lithohypha guttulata]
MGGGGSNKPIVFVFGTEKGDAAGRKKNLSAINTQVAYRAHERRREKKGRQRAQAKQDGKVDQSTLSADASASISVKVENSIDFNHFVPGAVPRQQGPIVVAERELAVPQKLVAATNGLSKAGLARSTLVNNSNSHPRPCNDSCESDLSSDISSEHDAIWSASPSSNQHSSPGTELSALSPLAPIQLNGYFDKALDPFFRLPTAATDREKWLVHFYQTKTIERKAKAFGTLNSILKSRVVDREEGITGIMWAAIIDSARTSMHLQALDRLINDTGGFEAFLDGPLGIAHPEHVATAYAFGPCPVSNLQDLDAIKARFLNFVRILHDTAKEEQEEKRRIRNRRPWDTLSRQAIDGSGNLVPAHHDEHFRYYVRAKQDCLMGGCTAPLLNATLNSQLDYSSQARHFAALVQTLTILGEFEQNYLAKAMFLKRLRYVAEMSTARDPLTNSTRLSHAGLLLINSYVRQEVQTHFDRTRVLVKGVKISKTVVDSLKIFALLQGPTRCLIVSWLRDWLCDSDRFEDVDFVHLQEEDLAAMSAEITKTWLTGVGMGT